MWNIFLNLTSSSNVLPEARRKWQISPLQSFPTMTNGRTALNPTGRECCWATKPLWPDEAWLMKEWKSGCEGIHPQSHEEVNGTPAIAVWNMQLEELHPFWDMKRQNKRRRKCLSGEFLSQGSWHPLHRFGFLRWSYVFVLCLYFSHHMMNYSVLQPYSKTTGNPLYVIQNKMQTGERENLSVCLCGCGLDFKTKRVRDTGWWQKQTPKEKSGKTKSRPLKPKTLLVYLLSF